MKYRAHRYTTRSEIVVTVAGEERNCTLFCVSSTGALIVGAKKLSVGQEVVIKYSGGSATAIVKWANASKGGVAFKDELTSESLDRIRYVPKGTTPKTAKKTTFTELQ